MADHRISRGGEQCPDCSAMIEERPDTLGGLHTFVAGTNEAHPDNNCRACWSRRVAAVEHQRDKLLDCVDDLEHQRDAIQSKLAKAEAAIKTVTQDTVRGIAAIYEGRATQYGKRAVSGGMRRDKLYADCYREMATQLRQSFGLVEGGRG